MAGQGRHLSHWSGSQTVSDKNMNDTPDILKRILARKLQEIDERNRNVSLQELERRVADADTPRGFVSSLEKHINMGRAAVIAEIKKASPSRGILREDFRPADIASSYEQGGAAWPVCPD